MEEAEVLEPYEIRYSDLMLLSSSSSLCSNHQVNMIMENLGPAGPGLLAITDVPETSLLRRKLLRLARMLALLSPEDRKRILGAHNLGSDVPLKNPDRDVSSFAMQLKYAQGLGSLETKPSHGGGSNLYSDNENMGGISDFENDEFEGLESMFKALGFCMMQLGLCLARIVDKAIGGNELEQGLLESCAAKGRLIHYHTIADSLILRKLVKGRDQLKNMLIIMQVAGKDHQKALTWAQMLMKLGQPENSEFSISSDQECASPRHSYLQIYDPNKNKVMMVKSSSESFIVQVGESADILSKGRLRSTLHCVCRPARLDNLSRETFVVFLQPAWSKIFSISDYPMEHYNSGFQPLEKTDEDDFADQGQNALSQEIQKIVPPLSARLKDRMTFAEFSRETTKQYYGGNGLQSNK